VTEVVLCCPRLQFHATPLPDAVVIELDRHVDDRGFFARSYCDDEFAAHGLPTTWPQCNLSRNTRALTLRGMHYNAPPDEEAKIVRCVAGAIWDAIVDLRAGSPTFLRWFGVELSVERGNALYVPPGFAHGFVTLRDGCDVFYHMGRRFRPDAARGLRWNDPRVAIAWPVSPEQMSDRDRTYPDFDPASVQA
jgi:dTDP-4-dehydrorhamnose 3,5-epimerase